MAIDFKPSRPGTLGVEWEVTLVDLATRQHAPRAAEVLAALGATDDGPIRGEYLTTMIELVTGVHDTVPSLIAELRDLLEQVVAEADARGLGVLALGTHPFSRATTAPIVEGERYEVVRDRNAWWGHRMLINGIHNHIGIPSRDLAMPLLHGFVLFCPVLLALSASSPFFEGEDTGFASQRTMLYQQLPTNGMPPPLSDWAHYEALVEELTAAKMIADASEVRWDVRFSARFGTLENRSPDASPTLAEVGCIAAWTQCFADHVIAEARAGRPVNPPAGWLVRENKWRAARYGLDAEVITGDPDQPLGLLREEIARWQAILEPIAERLGCAEELHVADRLLAEGASYERQRAVAGASGGDPVAVVDAALDETRASL